ncbi:39995_t:CDS:1, partial [Gigaspora margarita]
MDLESNKRKKRKNTMSKTDDLDQLKVFVEQIINKKEESKNDEPIDNSEIENLKSKNRIIQEKLESLNDKIKKENKSNIFELENQIIKLKNKQITHVNFYILKHNINEYFIKKYLSEFNTFVYDHLNNINTEILNYLNGKDSKIINEYFKNLNDSNANIFDTS